MLSNQLPASCPMKRHSYSVSCYPKSLWITCAVQSAPCIASTTTFTRFYGSLCTKILLYGYILRIICSVRASLGPLLLLKRWPTFLVSAQYKRLSDVSHVHHLPLISLFSTRSSSFFPASPTVSYMLNDCRHLLIFV